jgi:hypothetical protein
MRAALLASFALTLAGCATAPVVDASTALAGRDMATATSLYGRWDQKVMLEGRPHYIWRRAVVLNGETFYCELRAETGFHDSIRSSIVEGYPAACGLFAVQYTADYGAARPKPETLRTTVVENRPPLRKTRGAVEAASAGEVSEDASARTR